MTRRLLILASCLMALSVAAAARAQVVSSTTMSGTPPSDTPSIAVGGTIFADFTLQRAPKSTDAAGRPITPNSFNLTRSYINITGNVSHLVQFRITPDIVRETAAVTPTKPTISGSLVFRVKYVFMQLNLSDWTGRFTQSWIRLGVQQTPIVDWEEGVYRYRWQGQVFIERVGKLGSSDAGFSFHANLPSNMGEIHAGVYNGEGQNAAEANNQKSSQVRVTFRPLAHVASTAARGLRTTFFWNENSVQTGQTATRGVFNAFYEHRWFTAGFDYLMARDQSGVGAATVRSNGESFFITPFFKEKGNGPEMLIRFDRFLPDQDHRDVQATSPFKRLIVGFAYWFPHPGGNQTAALMVDLDRQTFSKIFPNSGSTATSTKIFVHGLISY